MVRGHCWFVNEVIYHLAASKPFSSSIDILIMKFKHPQWSDELMEMVTSVFLGM